MKEPKRASSELTLKKNTEGKRVRRWEDGMSGSAAWDRWLEPAYAVSLAIDRQKAMPPSVPSPRVCAVYDVVTQDA